MNYGPLGNGAPRAAGPHAALYFWTESTFCRSKINRVTQRGHLRVALLHDTPEVVGREVEDAGAAVDSDARAWQAIHDWRAYVLPRQARLWHQRRRSPLGHEVVNLLHCACPASRAAHTARAALAARKTTYYAFWAAY